VFGRSPSHRIAAPDDSSRVFRWLVEARYDPTGDAVRFEYRPEEGEGLDPSLAYEAERQRHGAFAQRYLKRIQYGNARPLGPDDPIPSDLTWHFEVVFDYGDHGDDPGIEPDRPWPVRPDPFSQGRAGFEVRTYRLLRRVWMFHRFAALGPEPVCVGETRLLHDEDPAGTTLQSVEYEGRRQDGGTVATRAQPPLTFSYSEPEPDPAFEPLALDALTNVPGGLTGSYRLVDLYGEGLPGILTEIGGDWFYKPNLGGGQFGPQERVSEAPSVRGGAYALGDFDRDGNPNLGRLLGRDAGFFEYDRNARRWHSFTPFASAPRVATDTAVQWVDLNADGLPDLVVPHLNHFTWYPSLGKEGFGAPVDIPIPALRDEGLPLVAQDTALRHFFADMTGDGLPDLVRVESGRVEYWPHLGHGRFGERVVMEGAPTFDHEGTFDPRRVRLTDIDGSGTADLLYLGRGEVRIWTNASGNQLVEAPPRAVPYIDDLASVQVLDLLADGTPCLVWSSALPGDAATPIRYLPLTGGVKPRLLLSVNNGAGRETRFAYGTSAEHYLRDRAAGRGWLTHLPSHVTVVNEKEELDLIGGGRVVSRYEYHDGHFDGGERTVRGFGLVDQYDAESHPGPGARPEHYTEPTCIRTWFHDGAYDRDRGRPQDFWVGDAQQVQPPAPGLERAAEVGPGEFEDGYRALVGLVLRQEVFATEEGTRVAAPLQVTQSTYEVRRLQPATATHPAAFAAHRTERLDYDYEGTPDDPRVAHHLSLEVDDHGLVHTEAHVAYPRRLAGPTGAEAQDTLYAEATRTTFAHQDDLDRYLVGVATETEGFELAGVDTSATGVVRRAELRAGLPAALAGALDVHEPVGAGTGLRARRREWERYFYWNDARTAALPLGQVGAPLLVHHEETACFTDPLVQDIFEARVDAGMLAGEGGYVQADGYWWQPGPTYHHRGPDQFYSLEEEDAPTGGTTRFTFDAAVLVHTEVRDALGNTTRVETDYQALAPARVTDANGTVTETRYDPLGRASVLTTHGTVRAPDGTEHPYGSSPLADYTAPPTATVQQVLADPTAYLQRTDRYLFYDAHAWARDGTPPHTVTLAREALVHDGEGGGTAEGPVQVVVSYVDGFGRPLQQKQRVDAGPAVQRGADDRVVVGADGAPVLAETDERWLVSGHTVYTNKQAPVRQYEPFFSPTSAFEADDALRHYGVAAEHHYDALGRRVRTDLPNGTVTRSEHTPWLERHYDANDTVADAVYRLARESLPADDPERQALDGALAHADTPTTAHVDALGREILIVEAGEGGAEHVTQQRYDGGGPLAELVDPRGLSAVVSRHDMLGRVLYEHSVDAGERWTLPNLDGDPIHTWDGRGVHLATSYDALGRPTTLRADGALGLDQVLERWTYGDALADTEAQARNAKGRLVEHRDSAGRLTLHEFTPGGDPLRHSRRLRADYKAEVDWTDASLVGLDADTFESRTHYDALGRVVRRHAPDDSTRQFSYLASGALDRVLLTTAGGELVEAPLLQSAQYNARGQRTRAVLGNDVQLDVDYDADTFRMDRLRARRFEASETRLYQDLAYTYDPVGNVVRVADAAQQPDRPNPHVLQGLSVSADATFTYDAFYRLTEATGRVHQALLPYDDRRTLPDPDAVKGTRHLTLNNGAAVERYTRTYRYDDGGNLIETAHAGSSQNWTQRNWVSPSSNRSLPAETADGIAVTDPEGHFDAAGHCVRLPHLHALDWNARGRLARAVLIDRSAAGDPDDAEYYTYDGAGQRRRKVTEKLANGLVEVTEKLYLDGCEIKRVRRGSTLILERHTADVGDGTNRLALVHRWVRDDRGRETDAPGSVRVHYQLQNHLGSSALELDESGGVITYEEFFPYGGSAFLAGDDLRDVRIKDYRYSGKERDDGTGLYYYGYRYYAPFIGNWLSPDPLGPADGLNLYRFVRNNPLTLTDPNGLQSQSVITTEEEVPEFTFDPNARAQYEAYVESLSVPIGGRAYRLDVAVEAIRDESGNFVRWWAVEISREPIAVDTDERQGGEGEGETGLGVADAGGEASEGGEDEGGEAGVQDATGTAADGDAGSSPDPSDSSADAVHDGTGDSTVSSGSGPHDASGDDPRGRGRGSTGTNTGGGGTDERGTGTGDIGRGLGAGTNGRGRGRTPGGTGARGGGLAQTDQGQGSTGNGGVGDAPTPDAPGGYDPNDTPGEGRPELPPNGYRPPPPGTLPGGIDPFGDPQGVIDGAAGDRNGASGQGGPGSGEGGNGQADEQGDAPPQRERDTLDTLVDIASYVTLDAFFGGDEEGGGDPNGIPGGMGLFDLNLGRWGQVAYVGLALVDLVMTVLTLGETKAMMIGAKQALRQGVRQLRRLAPLAKQAMKQAGETVMTLAKEKGSRLIRSLRNSTRAGLNWNPFKSRRLSEFWPSSQITNETVQGVLMQGLDKMGGGRIWASTTEISAAHVDDLTQRLVSRGVPGVDIISGTHGDTGGFLNRFMRESKFFVEDFGAAPAARNVNVHDITKMSDAQLQQVLDSPNEVILAWCHSERTRRIMNVLGLNFGSGPF
jgi:RHS repeat-associated protein